MNADEFEQQLRRQPLRTPPAEWRALVLDAAAQPSVRSQVGWRVRQGMFILRLSNLLWPNPAAWAGLAVIWMVILALNFATADGTQKVAKAATPSRETMLAVRDQKRELARLLDQGEPPPIPEPPKSHQPRPRSQRAEMARQA